ncbi:MAG: NAAT family transporter [Verrucomicrobia bacterium]|nr:NAAT family transporter [Verrucomicrobiota bacterium]
MEFSQLLTYFVSLLVICNPFSALPALLGLTHGRSLQEKRRTGVVSGFAVAVILVICTWIGGPLLQFLGITVSAFQCAGGIVVFMLALSLLKAEVSPMKQTSEDQKEALHKDSIAVVPLAIPLMAGPGAISAVIVQVYSFPGVFNQLIMSVGGIAVGAVLGIILYFAGNVEKMLGRSGINIVNRIGGLILAAIAVETIAKGVIGLFPRLSGG